MREMESVPLRHDELEAMKLCDLEGLSQEEAGNMMGVSRGTVQRLVESARKKVVKALIQKHAIVFQK